MSSTPTYRKILSVFLAEFDNVAGPRNNICIQPYSSPPLPAELFEKVYEFLIPKRSLYGQIVSVHINSVTFIGKPTQIEGSQYERNAYLFNIGFVLKSSPEEHAFLVRDMVPVVLKLSDELLSLEKERGLLSRQDWQSKTTLRTKLTKMVNQLYEKGCHFLVFDASHASYLKVLSYSSLNCTPTSLSVLINNNQRLRLDHVPVAIRAPVLVGNFASQIDPNLSQISLHINGVNCIDQIAYRTKMERETVLHSIRFLLNADMIRCIDIFRFRNRYESTNKLELFKEDVHFWEQCDRLVRRNSNSLFERSSFAIGKSTLWSASKGSSHRIESCSQDHRHSFVRSSNIVERYYYLYNSLSRKETVEQLVECHWEAFKAIDIRKWIAFGVLTGIIRRVYEYPICIRHSCLADIASLLQAEPQSFSNVRIDAKQLQELLTGRHCMEELACLLRVSINTLETTLSRYPNDILVWWIGDNT